ncbi:MAG: pyridoxal phosphate-dependent aminotransferase [Myxococcota bacterium]
MGEGRSAFRSVPRTGVIFVSSEAGARGFQRGDADWANLGQGQPETGRIESEQRVGEVAVQVDDLEYAPVAGIWELREAVAHLYNQRYRRGLPGQYSAENVAISGGGRAALTRAAAALGSVNLGHFLPDYTAYEELLEIFRLFTPIPIALDPKRGYTFGPEELEAEIEGRGLGALLLSNPGNPTGRVVQGEEMSRWLAVARKHDCALLFDEFYAHYVWTEAAPLAVSAAAQVEDVDRDPVLVFDGLTKNWRYPGWRTTWALGPKPVVEAMTSAGSFLDGGGARPLQRAAIPLLDPARADEEARLIRRRFKPKRDRAVERMRDMGFEVEPPPDGTFYVWASCAKLPEGLRDGMRLFERALDEKLILVPGEFFDVNPGRRRRASRFQGHVRISFGPEPDVLARGFDRLEKILRT